MFTGIVEELGKVLSATGSSLTISAEVVTSGLALGDSVAVNGVCLTATRIAANEFSVDVMPETLRRTNLGALRTGDKVNLERALQAGGRLGGHFVQGHVDGTGKVVSTQPEGEALLVTISAPSEVMRYVVEKGFIAVDGVSLTVARFKDGAFTVSLVKFTQAHILLANQSAGATVNLECDILGKYVERFVSGQGNRSGVSLSLLAEKGFL